MNRYKSWTASAVTLLAVTFTGPTALRAQEAGGESLFSINWGLSAWTVVVFLALLFVLGKFAWGPILAQVEAREVGIREALDEAAERQAEAQKIAEEQRRQLADARRQAQEIIAEGRDAGQKVRREIEEKAREEGQEMLVRARSEIEREKDAALDEIRKESVELALAAASRLLQQKLDAPTDRKLVLDYLDDLTERDAAERDTTERDAGAEA